MILPRFKDPVMNQAFDKNGFVVIDDFLNGDQIGELLAFYDKNESGLAKGFHASSHANSGDYRGKVSSKIQQVFTPSLNNVLTGYEPLYGAYTVKETGPDSFFDFHLDWSMVDESKMVSISVWCPLTDVDQNNGHLWVLKGSHRLGKTIRSGPGLVLFSYAPFYQLRDFRFEKVKLSNRAGQAVIYDHRLFHGSPPNMTDNRRLAINQTYLPTGQGSYHYSYDEKNQAFNVFEVTKDFYLHYQIGSEPEGEYAVKVGTIKAIGDILTQDQVNSLVKGEA